MIDPRLLIGGGALALIGGFIAGWQVQGWRCEARLSDVQDSLQAQKDALLDALNQNANDFEQARTDNAEAVVRDRETIRTIYRDRKIPADCALPADAARLLNEARLRANGYASGEPSKPVSSDKAAD